MAVSLIGSDSVAAASFGSLPAHQAGDLIVITARRSGDTTQPALAGGYTNIINGQANNLSLRTGYLIATGSAHTSGTWTNALQLVVTVWRSDAGTLSIGASANANATSAGSGGNVTYPALTLTDTSGASAVYRVGARASGTTNLANPPTDYTFIASVPATPVLAAHRRFSVASNPTADTVAMGANAVVRAHSVEIVETLPAAKADTLVEDFATDDGTFVDGVSGGSITGGICSMPYTTASTVKQTANNFDLTESTVAVDLVHASTHASSESYFCFGAPGGVFDPTQFQFIVGGASGSYYLVCRERSPANTEFNSSFLGYDPVAQRWLRFRHEGSTIFWDTAPAFEGPWTNQFSRTHTFTPSSHKVKLGAFNFSANQPNAAEFDNINGGTTGPPALSGTGAASASASASASGSKGSAGTGSALAGAAAAASGSSSRTGFGAAAGSVTSTSAGASGKAGAGAATVGALSAASSGAAGFTGNGSAVGAVSSQSAGACARSGMGVTVATAGSAAVGVTARGGSASTGGLASSSAVGASARQGDATVDAALSATADGVPRRAGTGSTVAAASTSASGTASGTGFGAGQVAGTVSATSDGVCHRVGSGSATATVSASPTGSRSATGAGAAGVAVFVAASGAKAASGAGAVLVVAEATAEGLAESAAKEGTGSLLAVLSASSSGLSHRSGSGVTVAVLSSSAASGGADLPPEVLVLRAVGDQHVLFAITNVHGLDAVGVPLSLSAVEE